MEYKYQLIRSNRKTISLELKDGELIVRAPLRTTRQEADDFVERHKSWIEKHLQKHLQQKQKQAAVVKLSREELDELYHQAAEYIPERARFYAEKLGVSYERISLKCQKTRWGSCSTKKNLNFNVLLMLAPPEAIDSVVVHELCHLIEMNHSKRFYRLVLSVFPEYYKWDRWLKENGKLLLARVF